MEIVIGKVSVEDDGRRARLQSSVVCTELWPEPKELYYEVDHAHVSALCDTRADAFVIGLLPLALSRSTLDSPWSIVVEDTPLSRDLYCQLTEWYIPTLCREIPTYYSPISIQCEKASGTVHLSTKQAVATGVSGGVDSTYTILKHTTKGDYRLTHGVYLDSMLDDNGMPTQRMDHWAALAEEICGMHDLGYLRVASNLVPEIYHMVHDMVVSLVFASYVFAVQNLISVYYLSSGYSFGHFLFSGESMPHYDLFNVDMLSTSNVRFYSTGGETTRLGKLEYLSRFEETKSYLMPCSQTDSDKPCGRCSKCTRTICGLYVLGLLDEYGEVFDLDDFYSDPNYHWGYIIMKRNHDLFCKEIISEAKKRNVKIPKGAWISAFKKWVALGFRCSSPIATTYRP